MEHTDREAWPFYEEDEISAAEAVLRRGKPNYWQADPLNNSEVAAFEREFAQYLGCSHAVAVMNGSVALDLALKSLGIGEGDEVVVSSRSFVASASCVAVCGARPVFSDIDRESQNITANTIKDVLSSKTKAIIAVHLNGWPCEMDSILELARENNFYVIEDCAQAHGAEYKGRKVGTFGDIAAWSFCQDKIVSTGGEGGMITTNNKELWNKAWSYKDHGRDFDTVFNKKDHPAGFRWYIESFGTNWRMTEMQAAIGRVQLTKLDKWVETRRSNAQALASAMKECPWLRVPEPAPDMKHAYYRQYAFVIPKKMPQGLTRDKIVDQLNEAGVPCMQGICGEIYREAAFRNAGFAPQDELPAAAELARTSIMFQVHHRLTPETIGAQQEAIKKVLVG